MVSALDWQNALRNKLFACTQASNHNLRILVGLLAQVPMLAGVLARVLSWLFVIVFSLVPVLAQCTLSISSATGHNLLQCAVTARACWLFSA